MNLTRKTSVELQQAELARREAREQQRLEEPARPHSNRWRIKRLEDGAYWCGALGWKQGQAKTLTLAKAGTLLAEWDTPGKFELEELPARKVEG